MNTPTKAAGFVVGLLAVFGAATGLGTLVGPVGAPQAAESAGHTDEPSAHTDEPSSHSDEPSSHSDEHGAPGTAAEAHLPGGLMVSQDGYTLDVADRQLSAESKAPLRFRILGPDGAPVTSYTTEHGKELHLITVRSDFSRYQHVHPRLDASGTWSVPLDLRAAGVYRVYADFTPAGRAEGLTLGADLSVSGIYRPQPLPAESRTAEVDGYTVTLAGDLVAGRESELTLSVSRRGEPVTDLQPYLEAYGHLVALRDRDLAYLHVHPEGSPDDGVTPSGPDVTFAAAVPSEGSYRLFLDFRHGDRVRTAEFTLTAGAR